ncbi:MAG: apolipoprotein N-acyltransferase, partial [Betaproteobacteria bacterium]
MKRLAAAFILGVLAVGAFAPFYLFPLAILALAALLALAERGAGSRDGFVLGFAFGLGHFIAGVSWVYVSLHDFGAMPAPAALGVTLLFCAYLALFPACTLALTARASSPGMRRLLVFPGAWVLTEWTRGWLFTGFPWLGIGYSQAAASPLAGLAPVAGVYGVGLATLASAGLAWQALAGNWRRPAWAPIAGLVLLWGGAGALRAIEWTQPEGEPVSVSLLQGNVPQSMK